MFRFLRIISIVCVVWITAGHSMQIYPITKTGRLIQLDGFLMEWKKDSAKTLGSSTQWHWDAVATREGLAGYISVSGAPACSTWTCTFLPRKLSPYMQMVVRIDTVASNTFYRVSREKRGTGTKITAEWVIPWDSIAIDSLSGYYKIGCMVDAAGGDTLAPIVFTGKKYVEKKAGWGAVYAKGVILAVLLAGVLLSQFMLRRAKRKRRRLPPIQ